MVIKNRKQSHIKQLSYKNDVRQKSNYWNTTTLNVYGWFTDKTINVAANF